MTPAPARTWACLAVLACALMPAWAMPDLIPYSDGPLDAAELFERVSPSIWLVMTADDSGKPLASGSAVVIAPELAVTNCHVLTKSASVTVRRDTTQYVARRDMSDEARDLCLLTVPGLRAPAVTLGHESSLRPGMRVYAIGSPRRLEQTISDGLLSALRRDSAGELQMVQTSAPISPGSSGGGLFDAHGRLIGITTSGMRDSQNLNFAVPARLVVELARRSGPAGRTVVVAAPDAKPARVQPEISATSPLAPIRVARSSPPAPLPAAPVAPSVTPTPAAPPPALLPPPDPAPEASARKGTPSRIEYRLVDRLTGNARTVVFTRDPGSDEPGTLSFNNHAWLEKPGGEVVRNGPSIAGEFDGMMPPGGWVAGPLAVNNGWATRYSIKVGDSLSNMDLRARIVGESTQVVGTQVLRVIQIEYTGYTQRSHSSVALTQNQNGVYRAMLVYAPEIARVLHFEARTRGGLGGGAYVIDEQFDLVSLH